MLRALYSKRAEKKPSPLFPMRRWKNKKKKNGDFDKRTKTYRCRVPQVPPALGVWRASSLRNTAATCSSLRRPVYKGFLRKPLVPVVAFVPIGSRFFSPFFLYYIYIYVCLEPFCCREKIINLATASRRSAEMKINDFQLCRSTRRYFRIQFWFRVLVAFRETNSIDIRATEREKRIVCLFIVSYNSVLRLLFWTCEKRCVKNRTTEIALKNYYIVWTRNGIFARKLSKKKKIRFSDVSILCDGKSYNSY